MAANKIRYIVLIVVIAVIAIIFASIFGTSKNSNSSNATTTYSASTSVATSVSVSTTAPTSSSTTSATSSITTTMLRTNMTDKYLMTFLACTGSSCSNPQSHMTYLAQSNDGSNWTLVPGFKPYFGSVPDLVMRGGNLYMYNPSTLVVYNISKGTESAPQFVTLKYSNGTIDTASFVDPSPILNQNGSIILFYLPGIMNQDPAHCPTGQSSCTKQIMSATEVIGSNGLDFVVDPGVRAGIQISGSETASDPAIFHLTSGYALYVSSGQSVLAFSSAQLQGNYVPIFGLPEGVLVQQGLGGVPAGYYDSSMQQYLTYVTHTSQGGTAVIKLAETSSISGQIPASAFATVVSGCNFPVLGCGYSVESPGVYPK